MKTPRSVLTILLFISSGYCLAATHYIDFAGGADTNSGTANTAPWKHAPGMKGCSGSCSSYSPSAGDRLIFKGGSTWPAESLGLSISRGGSSGSPIYFGVDTSWYSGSNTGTVSSNGTQVTWGSGTAFQMNGSWAGQSITINNTNYTISSVQSPYQMTLTSSAGTQSGVSYSNTAFVRPIFNGGFAVDGIVTTASGVSYVTLDSIEITGEVMTSSSGGSSSIFIGGSTSGNITLSNLDVHNWSHGSVSDNSGSGGGIYNQMYSGLSPNNIILMNSNVGNPENGGNIGACSRGMQQLTNNHLHDCSQACLHGCSLVHDNVVRNVGKTFDGSTHTNVFYADCFQGTCSGNNLSNFTAYLYNNWIVDSQGNSTATGGAAYPNPGTSGVSGTVTYYVFNNVVSCNTGAGCNLQIANEIDPYGSSGQKMNVYDWNNTYQLSNGGICVNVVSRSGASVSLVDVRNLQCISGTSFNSSGAASPTSSNILNQTVATANQQGYTAPTWAPTSGSGGTVGSGLNLSTNCSGTLSALCSGTTLGGTIAPTSRASSWDIGAYQFGGSVSKPAPPTALTGVAH